MTAPNPPSIKLMRQVTVKNEYHTKVYALIGPQSALHVGHSAVSKDSVVDTKSLVIVQYTTIPLGEGD